jgi:HlyD family secretion protein
MSPRLRWILIVVAVIAVVALLRFTLLGNKPVPATLYRVTTGSVEDAVTNSRAGTVRSRRRSRLGVEQPGIVASIPHREGSLVKKGEVLLELDTSTALLERDLAERSLDSARAAVVAAEAAAALAEQAYQRAVALNEK